MTDSRKNDVPSGSTAIEDLDVTAQDSKGIVGGKPVAPKPPTPKPKTKTNDFSCDTIEGELVRPEGC